MSKYTNSKIYKIINDKTDKIYIGSTTYKSLCERMRCHRCAYKNKKCTSAKELFDLGECQIILIENYSCNNKDELRSRERYYIELYKDICVNVRRPIISKKEHDEKTKLWITTNKTRWNEIVKRNYQKNNPFVVCECGSTHRKYHTQEHNKSLKHQMYLLTL